MKKTPLLSAHEKNKFDGIIDLISFNREIRHLVEILNTEIVAPETVVFRPISHPAGFVRLITKRRLTIAEAYIRLISGGAKNSGYVERIEALQVLMHHVWHSKNLSMPINTARVQIALMKKAVRMRGNPRAQRELMSDFARASYGKTAVIRRLLSELDLIEVPESGENLSQMHLGWDDHVHDSMTEGRKSPSQLVLDAFIKGISAITVAYYDAASPEIYEEIYHAGQILGIRVRVGIEFSVGEKYKRTHYMYIPPQGKEYETLAKFFANNQTSLHTFWDGLRENANRRHDTVDILLDNFNRVGRLTFNEPFSDLKHLQMPPLSWKDIEKVTAKEQANRIHLGQVIYQSMRPVALKRVLYLKNQYRELLQTNSKDITVSWEVERARQRFESAQKEYNELTPALCAEKYVAQQKQVDYDSAFHDENDILPLLKSCGGRIVFIHPLSFGLKHGIDTLCLNHENITDIEIFNLVDALSRDTVEIRQFASFLIALKNDPVEQLSQLLDDWHIAPPPPETLDALKKHMLNAPFHMRCASDAVGWSSNIPGMGFIRANALSPKSLKQFNKTAHSVLPAPVCALLAQPQNPSAPTDIFLMSSTQMIAASKSRDDERMTPARLWRYLNLNLRCLILAAIGFIPGYFCLGLEYAILWFIITGFRNIIVDLIASSGLTPNSWDFHSVDRENMCESLFFSGISVPILKWAKNGFDWLWISTLQLDQDFLYVFLQFWCIAFANGLYLVAHNTARGFDKPAIRGNFFRSVLSWPLATLGSYILTPIHVPEVVQSKIWSEVVAGFIEGTVKNLKQKKLAQKALLEVYNSITSSNALNAKTARIDILFFWSRYGQGRRVLTRFLNIDKYKRRSLSDDDVAEIQTANAIIRKTFTTVGSMEILTNVILVYYPEENLTILTDFIGETHTPFVRWLEKHSDSN